LAEAAAREAPVVCGRGSGVGVALAAGVAGVAFINARDAGEAARATSIVRGAQSLPDSDPTTAAMVLGTLQAHPEPKGLFAAARAAQGPLARAILRGTIITSGVLPSALTASDCSRAAATGRRVFGRQMEPELLLSSVGMRAR
jgi:hypothetical protein